MRKKLLLCMLLCFSVLFLLIVNSGICLASDGLEISENLSNNPDVSEVNINMQGIESDLSYENLKKADVPDIIDYETAIEKGHIARLRSEEKDLYSVVFRNDDGTNTVYMYADPIKYIDKNGDVKDKSNTIVPIIENSNYAYTNGDNDIRVNFPYALNDGIKLTYNDINITMKPNTKTAIDYESYKYTKATEEFIRYDNVFGENTHVTYTPAYMGYKEDIILTEYTGQSEFEFMLYTGGLELYRDTTDFEGGSLYLRNEKGETVASLGEIIIFTADNGNNSFGTYEYKTIKENEEYIVIIKVDPDYLKDDKTVYPVTIDPTVIINNNDGAGAILDVTLNSNTGSDGSSTVLTVGKSSTYGIRRVLMRFPGLDLNGIYPEQITSAKVYLRDLMCQTTGLYINCHAFQGKLNWSESSDNWATVDPNNYTSSYMSSINVKYTGSTVRYGFNILSAVQNWASKINNAGYTGREDIGRGIIFKLDTTIENSSVIDSKTFGSFNNATTSYKPYLEYSYTNVTPRISVNVHSIDLSVGETYQLTATTYPAGQQVGFHPYNPSIADVSTSGVVTATGVGTSTIIVFLENDSNIYDVCTVNVIENSINISNIPTTSMTKDTSIVLDVITTGSGTLVWSSSDNEVANVYSNNVLKAESCGTTTITATYGTASCSFVVGVNDRFDSQGLSFVYDSTPFFIRNLKSGKYIDVENQNFINGAQVNIWSDDVSALMSQQWKLKYVGESYYVIMSRYNPNYILSVENNSEDDWANIVLLYVSNSDLTNYYFPTKALWRIEQIADIYTIQSKRSGKYIDCYYGNTSNGTPLIQYHLNYNSYGELNNNFGWAFEYISRNEFAYTFPENMFNLSSIEYECNSKYISEIQSAEAVWNEAKSGTVSQNDESSNTEIYDINDPDEPPGVADRLWKKIILNEYYMDQLSFDYRTHVVLHEMGHLLGLDHNPGDAGDENAEYYYYCANVMCPYAKRFVSLSRDDKYSFDNTYYD